MFCAIYLQNMPLSVMSRFANLFRSEFPDSQNRGGGVGDVEGVWSSRGHVQHVIELQHKIVAKYF